VKSTASVLATRTATCCSTVWKPCSSAARFVRRRREVGGCDRRPVHRSTAVNCPSTCGLFHRHGGRRAARRPPRIDDPARHGAGTARLARARWLEPAAARAASRQCAVSCPAPSRKRRTTNRESHSRNFVGSLISSRGGEILLVPESVRETGQDRTRRTPCTRANRGIRQLCGSVMSRSSRNDYQRWGAHGKIRPALTMGSPDPARSRSRRD